MRRPGPRPLSNALAGALAGARPATLLARVQAAWPEVAGRPLATATAPVAEREGVFTPFHRLRDDTQGAGLGLSLVRQFARMHGGDAVVAAGAGALCCFRVTLSAKV